MVRGVFITIEGCEGTGKSTQAALLAEALREAGLSVTEVREPGGTLVSEAVRDLLLDPAHDGLDPRAEILLYEASRAELVSRVIRPALASGGAVVCDRFFDSTTAYQGYGRGLPLDQVVRLNQFATSGMVPDITIVL
ncbi:MAG: dTMP kinase, partial [Anaerosomatales bacterium]|nr:dTMP kinase [Anaerosomatales bacterium]